MQINRDIVVTLKEATQAADQPVNEDGMVL